MKRVFAITFLFLIAFGAQAQKITWVFSTEDAKWIKQTNLSFNSPIEKPDISIYTDEKLQQIEGFGACFNELGWEALCKFIRTR